MFKSNVEKTIFTDVLRENPPRNISGSLVGDAVLESVIRALLYPRMSDDECLNLAYAPCRSVGLYNGGDEEEEKRRYLERIIGKTCDTLESIQNYFLLINTSDYAFNFIEQNFPPTDKFKKIEKVSVFYQKSFKVACYCCPENRTTIVFMVNCSIESLHYLGVSVLTMFPWFFDPQKGITELEKKLIESLREKSPNAFMKCMKEYESVYDVRSIFLQKLAGFEKKVEEKEIQKINADIDYVDGEIHNLERRIADYLKSRREYEDRLVGYQLKADESENELMEYFKCNKHVSLEYVNDDRIGFVATAIVDNFDEDMAETMLNNTSSFVYRNNTHYNNDDVKMLIKAIFIDRTIKLKFCEAFELDASGNVMPLSGYDYDETKYGDCMPNPHIDRYSCLGNYRQEITECVKHRNYIGVIGLCINSTASLNWGDSAVMEEFFRRLNRFDGTCFITPECEVVNVKGAIEFLKRTEEKKEDEVDG